MIPIDHIYPLIGTRAGRENGNEHVDYIMRALAEMRKARLDIVSLMSMNMIVLMIYRGQKYARLCAAIWCVQYSTD